MFKFLLDYQRDRALRSLLARARRHPSDPVKVEPESARNIFVCGKLLTVVLTRLEHNQLDAWCMTIGNYDRSKTLPRGRACAEVLSQTLPGASEIFWDGLTPASRHFTLITDHDDDPHAPKYVGTYFLSSRLGLRQSITCLRCKMESFSPDDIQHRFCGKCYHSHDDMPAERRWDWLTGKGDCRAAA